ncbi:Uncharacterized conserved protein YndB, AHSA1/START domain [Propionibacterium cyclohexanicum]|uniref:Uncharacterized conserved protein YndB, AHSA1/START domain n=2 Tax=Propionibacterium cyclohexanicum TaxID=64702 RepID=A0A1H9RJ28_9ACTN|nr:Uncharacterized conserved protein YndB, AHSA1/START domain [Propionibacterium cyclohexanicum]
MTPGTLTITRTFAAPLEAAFDAWIVPAHFASWFGGSEIDVPLDTVKLDVRAGGHWQADMVLPGGDVVHWIGEYTAVQRPRHLALTLTDEPDQPERAPLTVDFAAVDGGTRMTFTQGETSRFSPEQYETTRAGYQRFFDTMASMLEICQKRHRHSASADPQISQPEAPR